MSYNILQHETSHKQMHVPFFLSPNGEKQHKFKSEVQQKERARVSVEQSGRILGRSTVLGHWYS
eukprot:648457-Amphidinium_carterae.1